MDRFSSRLVSLSAMLVQPRSARHLAQHGVLAVLDLAAAAGGPQIQHRGALLALGQGAGIGDLLPIAVPFSSYRSARPVSRVQISSMAR